MTHQTSNQAMANGPRLCRPEITKPEPPPSIHPPMTPTSPSPSHKRIPRPRNRSSCVSLGDNVRYIAVAFLALAALRCEAGDFTGSALEVTGKRGSADHHVWGRVDRIVSLVARQ